MTKNLSKKHFLIIYVIIFVIALVGIFYFLNNFIYTEKQAGGLIEPYEASLSGEYVCLPHKDETGPRTDECAFGLKTDTDEYYAVDFSQIPEVGIPFIAGDRLSASGLVTPIERLSFNQWERYRIDGVFSITDFLQVE